MPSSSFAGWKRWLRVKCVASRLFCLPWVNWPHVADAVTAVRGNSTVKIGHVEAYTQKRLQLFPSLYPNSDFPTNSIIIVPELPSPEWLVEIEAIAALP